MNSKLQQIKSLLSDDDSRDLERINTLQARELREKYRELPNDYLELLSEIGWGNYGFAIYSGPMESDEIFDDKTAKEVQDYLFVGDDMSGWLFAYDTTQSPWKITLLNHDEPIDAEQHDITSFVLAELTRE